MTEPHDGKMRTSRNGVDFIKRWEGLETKAYRDVAGVWTIGYGHTEGFRDGRFGPDAKIKAFEAETLLREDLTPREDIVARLVKVQVNQNEFDALVSFEFNTGGLHRSTALRRLNNENRLGAAEALTWWNKATIAGEIVTVPGLVRRRAAEAVLFLKPVAGSKTTKAPRTRRLWRVRK
jgi:lysozyme